MGATPTFEGFGRWPVAGQRMEPKDFQISVFQSRIFQNLARAQCSSSEWFIQTSDICLFLRYMNYAPIYSLGRGGTSTFPYLRVDSSHPPGSSSRTDMCLGMEGSSGHRAFGQMCTCSTCPICAVIPYQTPLKSARSQE